MGMKTLILAVLLAVPGAAFAGEPNTGKAVSPAVKARRERQKEFDSRLRAERVRFSKELKAERKTFKEGLAGQAAEEKKARLARFNDQLKVKRKVFRQAQAAQRAAFRAAQKKYSADRH